MPGLVRKLLVLAAADGLILQPLAPWDARGAPTVHIAYSSHAVTERKGATAADYLQFKDDALESHGVIGLLRIASAAYLVAIARREEVARLWHCPVYTIQDVALIPISSQRDAQAALTLANRSAAPGDLPVDENLDQDAVVGLDEDWLDDHVYHGSRATPTPRARRSSAREPGIAQDVIGKRGAYGRFADGWFSRMGWTAGQRRNLGMTSQNDLLKPDANAMEMNPYSPRLSEALTDSKVDPLSLDSDSSSPRTSLDALSSAAHARVTSLIPKLVRAAKLLFSSRTFYFSYDHDITTRLALKSSLQNSDTPLHKRVDPQYYFNRHLSSPFVEAGLDEYVLPIMQGFIGQRTFAIDTAPASQPPAEPTPAEPTPTESTQIVSSKLPSDTATPRHEKEFVISLISRRSTKRSGLRYLRRGVDEHGNVANSVETEQLLCSPTWDGDMPIFSFVQTRGSIPLFFTQTTYALKPVPVLHGSPKANQKATEKHFRALGEVYGAIRAVSLVNGHGLEAPIGQAYEDAVATLNEHSASAVKPVEFEWFDFHTICRGMKFDNVSLLVDSTLPFLKSIGWTSVSDEGLAGQDARREVQSGIVRTNCMDCLDRTNVVQSSLAEKVLGMQLEIILSRPGIDIGNDSGSDFFATLWADNGDAVSLAYTSTNALKGDFVRTRKRNVFGLLTDFSLTLSRYYHNLFEDFFVQAAIDYMLGKVNERVFADFEAGVRGVDLSVDIGRLRREAIDHCSREVLVDGEQLVGGWVVAAPEDAHEPRSPKLGKSTPADRANTVMQEVILLLTDSHVVRVHYDWETEQVLQKRSVALKQIKRLQWGTWICETLTPAQIDEARNVGLVIVYDEAATAEATDGAQVQMQTLACKALPTRSTVVRPEQVETQGLGERELVQHVCEEIARAAEGFQDGHVEIEEASIVDLASARRSAGYLDQITYSVKRLVFG